MNMKAASDLKNLVVEFGGPGSGRHNEGGLKMHPESSPWHPSRTGFANHSNFVKSGYKYVGSKSLGGRELKHQYEHPESGSKGSFTTAEPVVMRK